MKLVKDPSDTFANIDIFRSLSYNNEFICAIILFENMLVYVSEQRKENVYTKKQSNNKIIVVNMLKTGFFVEVSSKCVMISP